ncbi:fam-l protein [Plasmodium malariae]|uniref:Fam-l protein n=1 Tax=Plasmodium malariae TaxID=5858 RepID=A0A1D3JHX5_PLAMA|nr:fam-l protein [Plasmodium malariae]SBT85924.1 fam-l protein [Plasmodium malariae]
MKQKIKPLLFKKFSTFILLSWIYHIHIYMTTHNRSLVECYNACKKFYARNYRLLTKYKQDKVAHIADLKEKIINNGEFGKNVISNNEKGEKERKNPSCGNLSMNKNIYNHNKKNKSYIFETKNYSRLEKKIFKEIDYVDFLKNNNTINNKLYKKIIRKKYGLRIVLPLLLFFLLLTVFIIELSFGLLGKSCLLYYFGLEKSHLENLAKKEPLSTILNFLKTYKKFWEHGILGESGVVCGLCGARNTISETCILGQLIRILLYFVPFIILCITFISWIFYYHKKVKKYGKIKFSKK